MHRKCVQLVEVGKDFAIQLRFVQAVACVGKGGDRVGKQNEPVLGYLAQVVMLGVLRMSLEVIALVGATKEEKSIPGNSL
jgi:hypothetical protein